MNENKIVDKEKLYNDCRNEEVTKETYCLWHECVLGMPPMCFLEVGEWLWNSNLEKLLLCFKETVAWTLSCNVCNNADYATEDKSAIEILEFYSDDFDTSIKEADMAKQLIELLRENVNDPKLVNDYLMKIFNIFNKLGAESSFAFCRGIDECMAIVSEHTYGDIPPYSTVKEVLLKDYVG